MQSDGTGELYNSGDVAQWFKYLNNCAKSPKLIKTACLWKQRSYLSFPLMTNVVEMWQVNDAGHCENVLKQN